MIACIRIVPRTRQESSALSVALELLRDQARAGGRLSIHVLWHVSSTSGRITRKSGASISLSRYQPSLSASEVDNNLLLLSQRTWIFARTQQLCARSQGSSNAMDRDHRPTAEARLPISKSRQDPDSKSISGLLEELPVSRL